MKRHKCKFNLISSGNSAASFLSVRESWAFRTTRHGSLPLGVESDNDVEQAIETGPLFALIPLTNAFRIPHGFSIDEQPLAAISTITIWPPIFVANDLLPCKTTAFDMVFCGAEGSGVAAGNRLRIKEIWAEDLGRTNCGDVNCVDDGKQLTSEEETGVWRISVLERDVWTTVALLDLTELFDKTTSWTGGDDCSVVEDGVFSTSR